jgi:hypothetical protein
MKVFLSHSSADKWLARRIADDIAGLGAQTFLDEKDIVTGESIDAAIQAHLSECADFLILLSPASIKSEWVLIELGGALALKKNVIPVLLYLGANDIPKPISKVKGRDIADIEKYYAELKTRLPKKRSKTSSVISPRPSHRKKLPAKVAFVLGQKVTLPRVAQESIYGDRRKITFAPDMAKYCGLVATITQLDEKSRYARVDVDGGRWGWAYEWLVGTQSNAEA